VLAAGGALVADSPIAHAESHANTDLPRLELTYRLGTDDGLYARGEPAWSRDAERPSPGRTERKATPGRESESAAEQRAELRRSALSTVADEAKMYERQVTRDSWVLPTRHFHISTWFGEPGWYWSSGYHTGIDFVSACGTPEVAVTAGRVVRAGWDGPYGNQVRLRLPDGDQVWYNHMTTIKTHVGAVLRMGDLIGLMGETGNAYGCHLHLEYRRHRSLETPVDPAPYFAVHGINLHALQDALERKAR
jgi:murein DD-endopeptidase MepM/ murein hydrolase activator NlpD